MYVSNPKLQHRIGEYLKYPTAKFATLFLPQLTSKEEEWLYELEAKGSVVIPNFVTGQELESIQQEHSDALKNLRIRNGGLSQSRLDPVRDGDLISSYLYASDTTLDKRGLSFNIEEHDDYQALIEKERPSTLTTNLLDISPAFRRLVCSPSLINVISRYMGLVPQLTEAYARRNFPADYLTMNHFWHRDLNHPHRLVKVFLYISDCSAKNGPHEYAIGSHKIFDKLNGKRYFEESEVRESFDENKIISGGGAAGTLIIEDTRGLHRAANPIEGYRDLAFAVYRPILPFRKYDLYKYPSTEVAMLNRFCKTVIPKSSQMR